MGLKSVVELKSLAVENAKSKTVESICLDISKKIELEANEGAKHIEYFVHPAVSEDVLTKVGIELVNLGYKFECEFNDNYSVLIISW